MSLRKAQRGVGFFKLILILAGVGFVLTVGLKLVPEYIEYYKVLSDCKAIAKEVSGNSAATVGDVKRAFERRAEIDQIKGVTSADLDITKDGSEIVVSFQYQRTVPLFANISVLIDFNGTTGK